MRLEIRAEGVVLRTHQIARSQQAAIRRCLPRLIMVASRGNEGDGVQNDSSELPLSTHTRRMRFSGPLTGVLCKRPFPEFVAKIRIQRQRSSATSTGHVSKIATDRPLSKMPRCANDPLLPVALCKAAIRALLPIVRSR